MAEEKRMAAALELNEIGVLAVSRESETWMPDFSSDGRARMKAASPKGSAWQAVSRYFEEKDLRVVCVAHSGNGRAGGLAVAELALGLAEQGREVLVIDADIVRPLFAKPFQYQPDEGLVDMVLFGTSAGAAIRKTPHERVRVLTAGSPPIEAAEVYGARELAEIFSAFRAEWDVVLLHAPLFGLDGRPCEVVQRADATFIVLPSGGSGEEIAEKLGAMEPAPRVLGILRVRPASEVIDAVETVEPAPAAVAAARGASDTTRAIKVPVEPAPPREPKAVPEEAPVAVAAGGMARALDRAAAAGDAPAASSARAPLTTARPVRPASDRHGTRSIAFVVTLGGLVALGVGVGVAYLVQRDPGVLGGLLARSERGSTAARDESFASDPARASGDDHATPPDGEPATDLANGIAPGDGSAGALNAVTPNTGAGLDAGANTTPPAHDEGAAAATTADGAGAAQSGQTSPAGAAGDGASQARDPATAESQSGEARIPAHDAGESTASAPPAETRPAAQDAKDARNETAQRETGEASPAQSDDAPKNAPAQESPRQGQSSGAAAPRESAAGSPSATGAPAGKDKWGVHLSSFPYLNQAAADAEHWRHKGYSVTIISKEIPGKGLWYRVILGSYADKRSAAEFSEELKANEGLDYCAVVTFSPQ